MLGLEREMYYPFDTHMFVHILRDLCIYLYLYNLLGMKNVENT